MRRPTCHEHVGADGFEKRLPAEPVEAGGGKGGEDLRHPLLGRLGGGVDHPGLGLDVPVGLAAMAPPPLILLLLTRMRRLLLP